MDTRPGPRDRAELGDAVDDALLMRSTGSSIVEQAPPVPAAAPTPTPVQTGPAGPAPAPVQIQRLVSDEGFKKALEDMCAERLAEVQRLCGDMLARAEATREEALENLAQAQELMHEDVRLSSSNRQVCQSQAASAEASASAAAQSAFAAGASAESANLAQASAVQSSGECTGTKWKITESAQFARAQAEIAANSRTVADQTAETCQQSCHEIIERFRQMPAHPAEPPTKTPKTEPPATPEQEPQARAETGAQRARARTTRLTDAVKQEPPPADAGNVEHPQQSETPPPPPPGEASAEASDPPPPPPQPEVPRPQRPACAICGNCLPALDDTACESSNCELRVCTSCRRYGDE